MLFSLLGPATTSISQHQQNWPGRIISFILGRLTQLNQSKVLFEIVFIVVVYYLVLMVFECGGETLDKCVLVCYMLLEWCFVDTFVLFLCIVIDILSCILSYHSEFTRMVFFRLCRWYTNVRYTYCLKC